jgi:hypothetical protein
MATNKERREHEQKVQKKKDDVTAEQCAKLEWEKDLQECDKFFECMLEQDQSKTKTKVKK